MINWKNVECMHLFAFIHLRISLMGKKWKSSSCHLKKKNYNWILSGALEVKGQVVLSVWRKALGFSYYLRLELWKSVGLIIFAVRTLPSSRTVGVSWRQQNNDHWLQMIKINQTHIPKSVVSKIFSQSLNHLQGIKRFLISISVSWKSYPQLFL